MILSPRIVCAVGTIFTATMLSPAGLYAQGGAAIVRNVYINDGVPSRCIKPSEDQIWLTLRRAIVDKKGGWLKETATVSLLVTAQMRVKDARPVSFPLMSDVNVQGYSNGQVSLPIEYTFIDGLALKQDKTVYTGATIDMTIFNQQAKTRWGSALTALSEMAKKMPLPTGPISQSVSYLMDFGISALNKDTAKVDLKDQAKSATMTFNFDPSGVCKGDFEKTGTLAILQDPQVTPTPAGAVRVADIDNHCWSAELTPTFTLKAAKKDAGFACTDAKHYGTAYRQVTNNYLGLVLNAVTNTGNLGPAKKPGEDLKQSFARCDKNGIPRAACAE